ncbi:RNA-binding transcriptional accessory protein, partial [Priestia megaterium]
KLEDLAKGIQLEGTVRNVVDFGAFIDIGVKQDGLVHISKLTNRYVKHPLDVVSVGDLVNVWVEDVDMKKGRVALTMIPPHQ